MKRRAWRYVIGGAGFYLVFLLVFAPAQWAAWGVTRLSQGQLYLNQVDGSVWRGRGELIWFRPYTAPVSLGKAAWGINPLWLVTGRLGVRLELTGADLQAQVHARIAPGISRHSVTLQEGRGTFPATLIGTFYSPATLLAPVGMVRFNIPELNITKDGVRGKADIWWENTGIGLSTVNPLGDYHASLQGQSKAATLQLDTVRGALQLSGAGEWQTDTGQFRFQGVAKAAQRGGELEPLLKLFGPDQGNGQRTLTVNYQLPLRIR